MRILILRLSSIGDILLTSHFVRLTRNTFPHATIDFLTKSIFTDLLRYNPNIDNILEFDASRGSSELKLYREKIVSQGYDYIFDLHNNLRTAYLLRGLPKKKIFRIQKNKIKRALYVYMKMNFYKGITPIPFRYLETGEQAGITDDRKGLELFWSENENKKSQSLLADYQVDSPYWVVAPGAGFYTKRWPIDYLKTLLIQVLKIYPHHIILVGSAEERADFNFLEFDKKIVNLAGKLSLLETATVLSKSKLVLANDSGIMHMATAVDAQVVAIFGSTARELGFFPFRGKSDVIENSGLKCRPCSHVGKKHCPRKHFRCMRDITPKHVLETLKPYFEKTE